jgi:tetratricopeptide (TPR) repeat protein
MIPDRCTYRIKSITLISMILFSCAPVWAGAPFAGRLVYLQGQVAVRPAGTETLTAARLDQDILAGDAVITGSASLAAILCADETQLKVNENTILVLKEVVPSARLQLPTLAHASSDSAAKSTYEIPQGEIWLRNKYESFRFEVETPAVTGGIRGTELNVRVAPNGSTSMVLLEGAIIMTNPYGTISLNPGEEGLAEPGRAPTKQILLQPDDAVQWSLYYPGIFSYRDLPVSPTAREGRPSPQLAEGEIACDRGNLDEAQHLAEVVLAQDPANSRALTLMGWITLQKGRPREAEAQFERVTEPDDSTIIGSALARYRSGDVEGAYTLMKSGEDKFASTARFMAMSGYFALMVGRVDEAKERLEMAARQQGDSVLPRALLSQIYLVQNRKDAASREAAAALAGQPDSPLAHLSMGLVKIAHFDLPAARQHLIRAIELDPQFVDAYVYLAKIWLGSEFLDRAWETISKAMAIAPEDGTVLSLAGFVRLAFRDFRQAKAFWKKAVKYSPNLGEPHLGLALYNYRYRDSGRGLGEMLTATLLEPRASLFQTELGKALYQGRVFDKALDVYDYAKNLDPRDPTPHLYKGIALTDLSRPGEAIQEINRSIALNDNRAVFRSRIMLDRDLAVRNYSLARAYNQLGLQEWAFSKAVTAVKNDPLNSSAHLFLLNSYESSSISGQAGQLFGAKNQEALLFRALSPANQSTFTNIQIRSPSFATPNLGLSFDYTPMFEMPYVRSVFRPGGGAWEKGEGVEEYTGVFYGGRPGTAFYFFGNYTNDRGFRDVNDEEEAYNLEAAAKWEPTVKGTLTGFFQYAQSEAGDKSLRNNFYYVPPEDLRTSLRFRTCELAYVHRFNPNAVLLAYYTHRPIDLRQRLIYPFLLDDFLIELNQRLKLDQEFDNLQLQQQLILGRHTLIAGLDYFRSQFDFEFSQKYFLRDPFLPDFFLSIDQANDTPERTFSCYLLDYWRLGKDLVVELGVFRDSGKTPRAGYSERISTSLWSPRFGINYQINEKHGLRVSLQRHVNTHFQLQQILIPSEIAGFPWLVDSDHGADIRQVGGAWEAQWDPKTFSVLRFDAVRVSAPDFDRDDFGEPFFTRHTWKRYQGSLTMNRILTPYLGLSMGVLGKRVLPDSSFEDEVRDYSEIDPFLRLSFLHRSGWLGRIGAFLVYQDLEDRSDNLFPQVDLLVGKELGQKRGLFTVEVQNLFDRRFDYALEPQRDPEFFPARRVLCKLAFYF